MNNSRIALLGANGKAGSVLLTRLVSAGFGVNALIRNADETKLSSAQEIRVLVGDVLDPGILEELIRDSGIIVNAISNRGNSRPISSEVTNRILSLIDGRKDVRYFVITGKTVKSRYDRFSIRTTLQRRMLRKAYPEIVDSKQEEYRILERSSANWTLIRCPMIVDSDLDRYQTSLTSCNGSQISRTGLAKFIITEIEKGEHIRKAPFVYE